MKKIHLVVVVALGALLLAACSSATSTGSTTSTSTTKPSSGSAVGIGRVWPYTRATYAAVSADTARVGTDVAGFAATNGAGPTTQLVADFGTLSSALTMAQQSAVHAVNSLSSSAVGYSQFATFANALQAANAASTSAQSEWQSSAGNACLGQIQALNSHLKAANRAGAQLDAMTAPG